MQWYVYIILCSDNSLYTGITTDVERRFCQHASGSGAKYFRARKPVKIVYLEGDHSRCSAASREYEIKKMKLTAKKLLFA
ncbi:MAG: GIY-YIG nuclease family protein [Desulfuromonadaceae bacterium]|nr:GIY-YIG nuclease family protein [Desulfuromonadaceae bacterium]MDD2856070.1 GIY-YIG nuclease family protein [Desulfuromonadaceae bacterium]